VAKLVSPLVASRVACGGHHRLLALLAGLFTLVGCRERDPAADAGACDEDHGEPEPEPDTAQLVHRFGEVTLGPFEEAVPCVQWTLDNDAALYVQAVQLSNLGYFHHSNWFVVPEQLFPGPDGLFACGDRNFTELAAAVVGTVLFAQSTQSFVEEQRTGDGAIIKIPPRYKVIAGTHMLNVGPAEVSTELFLSLELIHPRAVEVVLTPVRLSYYDLDIPANARSRFTGVCDEFAAKYQALTGTPLDIKLHYVLPHYHYLGDYFDLEFIGGPLDGTSAHTVVGFNAEANGKTFDPPLDLRAVTGLRFTCGYDNWRDVDIGWGLGDQEMCVMLGLAESDVMLDVAVNGGSVAVGQAEGVFEFEGPCDYISVPKGVEQGPPTAAEIAGPFHVPASGDANVPPVPECVDHDPSVAPTLAPTLANVSAAVFQPSCSFSSCHGATGQAAGLNLQAPNLLSELLDHEVVTNPGATLVEPGDPHSSWLYQRMASCAPQTGGVALGHMPRNSPVLLGDETVALVREWIAGGALP